MTFLADARLPTETWERYGRVSPTRWDTDSRRAGVVRGAAQWESRLAAARAELVTRYEQDPPPWLPERLARIDALRAFVADLHARLGGRHERASWQEHLGWLRGLLTTYVADAAGNTILSVKPNGKVKTLAVLPPVPVVITPEAAAANKLPACTVGRTFNFEPVPTDVEVVVDHARRATTGFPHATTPYYGVDYPSRVDADHPDADRLDWYRNIPVPTSYMAVGSKGDVFGGYDDIEKLFPICTPGASDTARFDEELELLHLGGRSLAHAVLMMITEAWERHPSMDHDRRAFYQYNAYLMEPWDGPAALLFTDGHMIGAMLDRNGLRPLRYAVTDDGRVLVASEAGVLPLRSE